MAKKYDIKVYDEDPTVSVQDANGVIAENPKALADIYKMSHQRIEIIREYEDEESRNYGKMKTKEIPKDFEFLNGGGIGAAPGFMKVDHNLPQYNPSSRHFENQNDQIDNVRTKPICTTQVQKKKNEPPRFFEIGGIKCKMENGKMYQKQWMRLSETESQEFRIVSDKNNKICPIKGKHIEIMKWVLVQDENENSECSSEKELELLNG